MNVSVSTVKENKAMLLRAGYAEHVIYSVIVTNCKKINDLLVFM